MSVGNTAWGAPGIHGELLKVGIEYPFSHDDREEIGRSRIPTDRTLNDYIARIAIGTIPTTNDIARRLLPPVGSVDRQSKGSSGVRSRCSRSQTADGRVQPESGERNAIIASLSTLRDDD